MSDMPRIGRRARPGEATIAMMRESPEVLDRMAFNAWCGVFRLGSTADAKTLWDEMSEHDRDVWRDRAFARASEEARAHDAADGEPPPDDPGDGGQPLPIERIA